MADKRKLINADNDYKNLLAGVVEALEAARRTAVRSVDSVMTIAYWDVGRRIVENEQKGEARAEYGKAVLKRLSCDLKKQFGRGFSRQNLQQMRQFYLVYSSDEICQTMSGKSLSSTVLRKNQLFPLSWSHYVELLSVKTQEAKGFYETEAVRGGWTVRQLKRQIGSQFYERALLSKNKALMLTKGARPKPDDFSKADEEIKSPYVLEFLGLKDEYSESELEEALIHHLESFLLELGDFTFIGRQKRLRIGDEWYKVDLVFFHRRLKCLVLIDLKLDKFSHADAGQMNLYCNYAAKHWTHEDENPPVGLIVCTGKNEAVAEYALGGISNKILTAEYQTALPDTKLLEAELKKAREVLEHL